MSRAILQVFEDYQKSRMTFVHTIAELAVRTQNIDTLHSAGVIGLLKPLLIDSVPAIQQSAALAIGRLANHSEDLAESVIQNDIVSQLIYSLSNQNRFFKKASCYVLRAVAKHSPQLSEDIVNSGALEPLVNCLDDFDATVKESAAWALGYIAKHNERLAANVKDAKAIEGLLLCLKEPEISLKRCAVQTLSYISFHSDKLALPIAENGLDLIVNLLNSNDMILKRNVCMLLGNISKHSIQTANLVMNVIGKPLKLLICLKDPDMVVKKNAAFCILEIVNKSKEMAKVFVDEGACACLNDYINNVRGEARLFGILALGFIGQYQEDFAMSIIHTRDTSQPDKEKGVITALRDALINEQLQQIKSAACYTLGNLGKFSPKHSEDVSKGDVLPIILRYYVANESSPDLKAKAKKALKNIINNCWILKDMEPLMNFAPENIMKNILRQHEKILKSMPEERKRFLQPENSKVNGIVRMYEIKEKFPNLSELISSIFSSAQFPDELINFYDPEKKKMELENLINGD